MLITSRHNELLKQARAVRLGRNRQALFIEGVRLCEEAARSALVLEAVIHAQNLTRTERGQQVLNALLQRAPRVACVPDEIFNTLSDVEVHQGVCVLARTPATGPPVLPENAVPLLLILHGLNNPSNAGALLRTAEAAGVNGVIATAGTTYLFAPKALRGAMGAAFRLPVWMGATLAEVVAWCRACQIRTVCADVRATVQHTEIEWTRPTALVMGREADGLTDAERALLDDMLRIPMHAPVESLNVAVAAGIALYEAARQREFRAVASSR